MHFVRIKHSIYLYRRSHQNVPWRKAIWLCLFKRAINCIKIIPTFFIAWAWKEDYLNLMFRNQNCISRHPRALEDNRQHCRVSPLQKQFCGELSYYNMRFAAPTHYIVLIFKMNLNYSSRLTTWLFRASNHSGPRRAKCSGMAGAAFRRD